MADEKKLKLQQALVALLDLNNSEQVLKRFQACFDLISSHGADFEALADERVVSFMEIHIQSVHGKPSVPARSALNTLRKQPWALSTPRLFATFGKRIMVGDSNGLAPKLRRAMQEGSKFDDVLAEMRLIQNARQEGSSRCKWPWRPADVDEAVERLGSKRQPSYREQTAARKRREVRSVSGKDDEGMEVGTSVRWEEQDLEHHTETEANEQTRVRMESQDLDDKTDTETDIIDDRSDTDDDREGHGIGESSRSIEIAMNNDSLLSDKSSMQGFHGDADPDRESIALSSPSIRPYVRDDSTDHTETSVVGLQEGLLVCTSMHLPPRGSTRGDLAFVQGQVVSEAALQQHLLVPTSQQLFAIDTLCAAASVSTTRVMALDAQDVNAALDVLTADDPTATSLPLSVVRLLLESFAPRDVQIIEPGSIRIGQDAAAPVAGEEYLTDRFFLPVQHDGEDGHHNRWSLATVTKRNGECYIAQCCLGVDEHSAEEAKRAVASFCTTLLGFDAGDLRYCDSIKAPENSSTVSMLLHALCVMLHTSDPSGILDLVVYARLLAHALQSTSGVDSYRPAYEEPPRPQLLGIPPNTRNALTVVAENSRAFLREAEGFISASQKRRLTCSQVAAMTRTLILQIDVARQMSVQSMPGIQLNDVQRRNLLQEHPRSAMRKTFLQALYDECGRVEDMIGDETAAMMLIVADARENLPNSD